MSRLEFRAAVEAPRPPSAWIMVGIGAGTLWITGQLEAWAMALQAAALLGSLGLRRAPRRWQQSPWVLNSALFGILAVTVSLAARGAPSTVALAHFAALVQGLQLLDARPRKSEFLLVVMALFQVLLAANLTDSLAFPVLLLAFLAATTWTLIVHTLRTEALEAGDGSAAGRALTPRLLRTTLVCSALSLVLAMVLFLTLPRLRGHVLRGMAQAPALARAGFSDRVELGAIGHIRKDPTIVMRIETLAGRAPIREHAYWRGLAFDHFDGQRWSIEPNARTQPGGSPEFGMSLGRSARDAPADLQQRIVREPVEAGVLFTAGPARRLVGPIRRVQHDPNGGLYAAGQAHERVRYSVWTRSVPPAPAALREDRIRPPRLRGGHYLDLPPLSPAVAQMARDITRDAATDLDRVQLLERHLRTAGRYTDTPPVTDTEAPVEAFLLGELAGHCEYFASGMVVLARSLGLPTRLVNGFAGGRLNRLGGFVEVAHSDAHAWVEVHFEQAGWVRFDPTPPDLRLRAEVPDAFGWQWADLASAAELWWYQRVVGFDRSDQIQALRSAWLAWQGGIASEPTAPERRGTASWRASWGKAGWWPFVVVGLALVATWGLSRSRRASGRARIPTAYSRALRLLARRGLERAPGMTARAFAERVRAAVPAPAGRAFAELTEAYLAERFGAQPPMPAATAALQQLETSLRRR
ncbi:MAG: DUF3488 and transglutaminase-like domain-containing protein [Proteobacteria bacterium]|nr:DUF3488 and transglutaminase-like domain-containing protein [Pseudomonadota bacterium]